MDQQNSMADNSSLKNDLKLVDIPITDENTALNVMVSFLGLAQKHWSS